MRLSDLASDLLDVILTDLCHSYVILLLWQCGDQLLNARIASGLSRVRLERSSLSLSRFPPILLQLRSLRDLSIKSKSKLFLDPVELSNAIKKLPRSLEKLSIASQDVLYSLVNFDAEATAKNLTHISTVHARGTSRCYDLEAHFPRLLELKIEEEISSLIRPTPLPQNELSIALPSNLTSFTATKIFIDKTNHQFMSVLPRTLNSLHAVVEITVAKSNALVLADWEHAPPHLEYLQHVSWNRGPENFSWLPRSLTGGRIQDPFQTDYHFIDDTATVELKLRTLPPRLSEFAFQQPFNAKGSFDHFDMMALLPGALSKLEITLPIINFIVASLPSTLQTLTLIGKDSWNWQNIRMEMNAWNPSESRITFWPPALRSLNLGLVELSPKDVDLLPSTLHELTFRPSSATAFLLDYKLNLAHLTSLTVQFNHGERTLNFQGVPSLTALEYVSTTSRLSIDCIEALPASLTSLKALFSTKLSQDAPWQLPPSLTTLHVGVFFSAWFELLPRTLTDLSIQRITTGSELAFDWARSLPQGLRHLRIREKWHGGDLFIPSDSFSTHVNLETLDIVFSHAEPYIFQHLPPKLKVLRLKLTSFYSEMYPYIPSQLTVLDIGEHAQGLSEFIIPYWPFRSLETLPSRLHSAFLKRRYNL